MQLVLHTKSYSVEYTGKETLLFTPLFINLAILAKWDCFNFIESNLLGILDKIIVMFAMMERINDQLTSTT